MVGINADQFWDSTWKYNHLVSEAYEIRENKAWERDRYIAYTIFTSTINSMNGKPVFKAIKKPTDLFSLPQDKAYINKPVKIDKERAARAVDKHKKVWLQKN